MFEKLRKLSAAQMPILIMGETGTGKSRLARKIHEMTDNRGKFVQINMCNFSKELLESQLFGHEKGSFTGAVSAKIGFCEKVHYGTILFDEIGEISLELQSKLLMLLEEKIFYPLGSTTPRQFKANCIFATNRNLAQMVKEKTFREDLYFRICTNSIHLSPVREKDLITLIENCFYEIKVKNQKMGLIMDNKLVEFLKNYSWPGNYRELVNVINYIVLTSDKIASCENLPGYLVSEREENFSLTLETYHEALDKFEKEYLIRKLKEYEGKINYTSKKIRISKPTLISKIRKYGINIEYDQKLTQRAI